MKGATAPLGGKFMKYYVITKWNNGLLNDTIEEYNNIVEALTALNTHRDFDGDLLQACYLEDERGWDYDDILIEAKQRMMDDLLSDDYDYCTWINNNYNADYLLHLMKTEDYDTIMEEIGEAWVQECQDRIDEEDDDYILSQYTL